MNLRALQWGICSLHGRQLHACNECVSCRRDAAKPASRIQITEPKAGAKLKRPTAHMGRPRSLVPTDRELEICRLMAYGMKTGDIAKLLGVTTATIQSMASKAGQRLGLYGRDQLVEWMRKREAREAQRRVNLERLAT